MKRYPLLTVLLSAALSLVLALPSQAAENPWEGMYELIDSPQPAEAGDQVQVIELFLYTCPHCYSFESYTKEWLANSKPDYVNFELMPAVFNPRNVLLAKAFYTAKTLGVLEQIHVPLFKAIHEEDQRFSAKEDFIPLFVEHGGVTEEAFNKTFDSFSVDNQVRRANSLTVAYGLSSVPSVVVAGKYRLSPDKTKGFENKLKIINYLAAQEMQANAQPAPETEATEAPAESE